MAAGESEVRKGPWTLEEDSLLLHYIACHGEGRWNLLARSSGLRRTGKSCRLRWLNYLKPDVKRGNLSPQEQLLILELHSRWGNRWSKIAQYLPGRTDNEIKNYWRTRVQKHARQLNIDSNSARFQDTVRCLWIPRLLQQMQSASAHSNKSLINSEPAHLLNQPPQATAAPEHLAIYEHNTDSLSVFSDASLLENSGYGISPGSLMGTQIHEMSELSAKNPSTLSNMGMGCNYPFDISSHVGSTPYDVGIFNHASASTPFQIDNISALEYCCMSEDDWVDDMATSCGTWMSFQDHL